VPVQLYSAVEEKDIHFHQMSPRGHRIKYKRVDEKSGREVEYRDIVKGYEVSKGKFVTITPEELAAAEPEKTRTIEIEDFVDLEEIDPIYFASTYYVAAGKGGEKPYALLRAAMDKSGRIAIGRFVMRTKEYLVALRPSDDVIMLHTMYFPDEIRATTGINVPTKRVKATDREVKMAQQLVDSLTTEFDPAEYKDTHRQKVLALIKKKGQGKEIEIAEPERKGGDVLDLMEALKNSLEQPKKKKPAKRPAKKRRAS
jgi:DNA end-binding protein Ku